MINVYFTYLAKLVIAFSVAISLLPLHRASAHVAVLKPGDEIDGMQITTGAADAPPLWAFCSSQVIDNMPTANCQVPQMSALGIGYVFLPKDHTFSSMEWSALEWQLYIDDKFWVNLGDFGTYSYVMPTMAPSASVAREVFVKFTAWDVALTNLQPGTHTIRGVIRDEEEEYRWVVNLVIEERSGSSTKQARENNPKGHRSQCPQNGKWLSPFHHSCKMYG